MTPQTARSDILSRDGLPSLTGLRFWAALLVVLYHLTSQVGPVEPFSSMARYGRSGVTFFFVLSGFVLAWNYLDRPFQLPTFLWRRFARLWPLVVVTGLLSILAYTIADLPWEKHYAWTTFTLAQAWNPRWSSAANPAAWSISAEAFFYLAFPLMLALAGSRARRRWLWAACALAMLAGWVVYTSSEMFTDWYLSYFPVARLVQFGVGVLCAVAMRRGARAPVAFWPAVGLVLLYHALLLGAERVVPEEVAGGFAVYSGSQWWAVPVFALLIAAAAQADLDSTWTGCAGAWSLRLGHWSFALYLIHEPIVRVWTRYVDLPTVVAWPALLTISLATSAALYGAVEHPAEKWLRRVGPGAGEIRRSQTAVDRET